MQAFVQEMLGSLWGVYFSQVMGPGLTIAAMLVGAAAGARVMRYLR